MTNKPLFALEDILPVLPHRPPFLFVDRVMKLEPHKLIIAERTLRPDEPQFAGHFPGRAIMPGVLVTEALAQTSGLLLGLSERVTAAAPPESPKMFFLAANTMKYQHPAAPGDVLVLRADERQKLRRALPFQRRGDRRPEPRGLRLDHARPGFGQMTMSLPS